MFKIPTHSDPAVYYVEAEDYLHKWVIKSRVRTHYTDGSFHDFHNWVADRPDEFSAYKLAKELNS